MQLPGTPDAPPAAPEGSLGSTMGSSTFGGDTSSSSLPSYLSPANAANGWPPDQATQGERGEGVRG